MSVSLARNFTASDHLAALHRSPPQPAMHFAQDSSIYEEGDAATCFYRIVSGVVRICRFAADGRRHIDAFHTAGEVFGFELGDEHGFTAEAVTDCSLIACRRRGTEAEAARDEAGAMQLFGYAMHQLSRARAHTQLLGRASALQKIAAFLLECAAARASLIELPMTRQDIADYLGLTIETVSRSLAQLERSGVIVLKTARLIMVKDQEALQELGA